MEGGGLSNNQKLVVKPHLIGLCFKLIFHISIHFTFIDTDVALFVINDLAGFFFISILSRTLIQKYLC